MNPEAIDLLIRKNPRLKAQRDQLEALQEGAYIIHRSWGVGRIREYSQKDGKLIIDFEDDKQGHPMDPAFCVGKVEILGENDLIVRKRSEPDVVEEMIQSRPADLIVEYLSRTDGQSATNHEIETMLSRLLGEKKYKKWWTATKKLLVKDPRVATPSKKTDPYVLRDEPLSADEEVLEEFYRTKNSKKKIALGEKLLEVSTTKEDLVPKLPDVLKELTASLQSTLQLNEGERLHGIWVRNDLARFLHDDPESLEPTSRSLLEEHPDIGELVADVPASYYKRFLDLITRVFPATWKEVIFGLLRNSEGKFTNECIVFLMERGCSEELDQTLERWLDEQALKGPLLYWILKNRKAKKYAPMLQKLVGPRLFHAIFYAIDYESLQNASARRIPLADVLSEDKDVIPELLEEANAETARDLATTLMLNQGFEDLTKKSLLARFIALFPNIQSLVAGEAEAEREDILLVSQESLDRYKTEYEDLVQNKIPANKIAINEARELGDLRENSEYKMARQDQDTLLARKEALERDFARARVTDFSDAPSEQVGVGSVVEVEQGSTGQAHRYIILGAWDSDPDRNILSYLTPLAQSLQGKRPGQTVQTEVAGEAESWTIRAVSRFVDEPAPAGA